jgi:hypothetical protein
MKKIKNSAHVHVVWEKKIEHGYGVLAPMTKMHLLWNMILIC